MSEAQNLEKAKAVYAKLVKMLEDHGMHFEKEEEKLLISSGFRTDDFPVSFIMVINPDIDVVRFLSKMPFETPDEKKIDMALAVCSANYALNDGSFDYDLATGDIIFRLTASYAGGVELTEDALWEMMMTSTAMVDHYNDKFFMLAKGMVSLKQFIAQEN